LYLILGAALALSGAWRVSAASLLLDFGPTAITSTELTNSPGHATGAVPVSETTWNSFTADTSSLLYSDGTTASGVSVSLGREATIGNHLIDYSLSSLATTLTGTNGPTLGSDYGTGTSAPAARDGLFVSGSNGGQNAAVGVRVDGLSAGTYTLYFVGRNTNTATATPLAFFVGTGASAGTFDFSALTETDLSNSLTTGNSTFVAGNQYNTASVTITAGQSIYLAADGPATGTEKRGFLNSLEIVPVTAPEPSLASLLMGGFTLIFLRRRRSVAR
jgi:hypothetical protein